MAAVANVSQALYQPNYHQQQHLEQSLPPYSKLNAAKPPPPYFFSGVDITNLPPLPETPSESDELASNQQYQYTQHQQLQDEVSYWDGQEVFRYYSPENGDVLYFSGDEGEYERRCSPADRSYHKQQQQQQQVYYQQGAAYNYPEPQVQRGSMGSGSSSMNDEVPAPRCQKQSRKSRRNSSSGSDNGGFECATPKTSLGVKEKLRSSLDKISLKPFRWNSSDKLTHSSGSSSKKSKSNRRYSDSGAAFAAASNNSHSADSGQRSGSTSCEASREINPRPKDKRAFWKNAPNRLIRPVYLTEPPSSGRSSLGSETTQPKQTTNPAEAHNYVNLAGVGKSGTQPYNHQQQRPRRERASNEYHQIAAPQTGPYYDLGKSGKDTAARAKGTWNMLKTANASAKPAPMKASTAAHSSYASLVSGSSETLQSSGTAQGQPTASESWVSSSSNGGGGGGGFNSSSVEASESASGEPPRLAPVSGKLLLDKASDSTILRPTAFKPVVQQSRAAREGMAMAHAGSWERIASDGSSPRVDGFAEASNTSAAAAASTIATTSAAGGGVGAGGTLDIKTTASDESNHSDSGRHSATSIPVASNNSAGGSFCCSGSEGYDSARVSSSTNHSAMHENDPNASDSSLLYSPKNLSDDVMIRDLECRVKAKEGELQLLRRSFEDNEKALHMVYEDRHVTRDTEIQDLKQRYSNQLRAQTAKVMKQQRKLEREYQQAREENRQLLRTNIELEDRVKSMSDSLEQRRGHQQESLAELRARLEESESQVQHKHGELSHLKRQLKDRQAELEQRTGETVALRTRNRDLGARLKQRDCETNELAARLLEREREVEQLERSLDAAESSLANLSSTVSRNQHVNNNSTSRDDRNYLAPLKRCDPNNGDGPVPLYPTQVDSDELLLRLRESEELRAEQTRLFDRERQQWAQEKNRVIRYQKQLQLNYVQMFKRSQTLEEEVEILTSQLGGPVSPLGSPLSPADVHSPSGIIPVDMCYPMEI